MHANNPRTMSGPRYRGLLWVTALLVAAGGCAVGADGPAGAGPAERRAALAAGRTLYPSFQNWPTDVVGFRLPRLPDGAFHVTGDCTACDELRIDIRYKAPGAADFSPWSVYWDSRWRLAENRQLLDPWTTADPGLRFPDCQRIASAPEYDQFACRFDDFVGREGAYEFKATSWVPLPRVAQATVTFTSPAAEGHDIRFLWPTRNRTATVTLTQEQGSGDTVPTLDVVHLYGTPWQRGYAHGYLLAEDIRQTLVGALNEFYRCTDRIPVVDDTPVCYESTTPEGMRTLMPRHLDLPVTLRMELEGILAGMSARLGDELGLVPYTFPACANTPCGEHADHVTLDDLIMLNTLDEFCRSFMVFDDRTIDASASPGLGRLAAFSIEWAGSFQGRNRLFVHHVSDTNVFAHASWPGFIVGYGPLLNTFGVTSPGIVTAPGRPSLEGNYEHFVADPGDIRRVLGAEVRAAFESGPQTALALSAAVGSRLGETGVFPSHSADFVGPEALCGTLDVFTLEILMDRGLALREPGDITQPIDDQSTLYDESLGFFQAATCCSHLALCDLPEPLSCNGGCVDLIDDPSLPYKRSDDYDRIFTQLTAEDNHGVQPPHLQRTSLTNAERILQDVAEESNLLIFSVLLPTTREWLLGFNTPDEVDGGKREAQAFLTWPHIETAPHAPIGCAGARTGDVTLDDMVSAADAQVAFLLALAVFEDAPSAVSLAAVCPADCNGDGAITAGDAQAIFFVALGMQPSCIDPLP